MKIPAVILCALCTLLVAFPSQAANITFVSFHGSDLPSVNAGNAGFTNAPDKGYTDFLTANGHTVTRLVSADNLDLSGLASADLVIISRSVASGHYQQANEATAWNGLTKPVIILGGYIIRGGSGGGSRLGFTSGETIPDVVTNDLRIKAIAPGHPIFNGIALDGNGRMVNTYATLQRHTNFLQRGISVNSSAVTNGGVVLGVVGTLNDAATGGMIIGEWLPGAVMGTNSTPLGGRRLVFLTGSRESAGLTSEGAGIYDLTADGAQMLLNAVTYMLGTRSSIRTVTTVNNENPGAGETSLRQALTGLQDGDYIRFNIPGAGPHVIVTPIGGYPLITNNGVTIDGYTQFGSVRNSNPILGGNNAQIKIVLDSTGTESAPNPDPNLPNRVLRRSTRLDFPGVEGNTGYGDGENCIIGVFEGDHFAARGLSFIARPTTSDESDPSIYCIALVKQATNAHVSGCLFGMAPGGTTMANIRPPAAAVAAFRWRVGGDVFSDDLTFGTDGDGINDRAEFNVTLGARIALALELVGPKISGNYGNVFPNGTNFVDIDALYAQQLAITDEGTLEFLENGRVAHNTVVGTDGDGISDSDERNVIAHTVYDVNMEFYSAPATNNVIAGNYVGVGIDGITPSPRSTNQVQDFAALPSPGSTRIGSNGDGISDDLEGNLIVNGTGNQFTSAGPTAPVAQRRNRFVNCNYVQLNNDTLLLPPTLNAITNNVISGTITPLFGEYIVAFIDVYTADPAALVNTNDWPQVMTHPSRWLGSFADNGPGDLDIAPSTFAFDISQFGVADSNYVTVTVTYSKETTASNAGLAVTTEPAAPVSRRPSLTIHVSDTTVTVSWIAPDEAFVVQQNNSFDPNSWLELFQHTHEGGRNINESPKDTFPGPTFYRLISQ